MTTGSALHWDAVYAAKAPDEVSWFQARPATSMRLVTGVAQPSSAVIDVGAGASLLADSLIEAGWTDITLLDISATALADVRHRLGTRDGVTFVISDIASWEPDRRYDVWHDRAAFHFLVEPEDRNHYVAAAQAAVASGGAVVLATFAPDGPQYCSALPTNRYDAAELATLFEPDFALEHDEVEQHVTPAGAVQPFTWVVLRRR